MRNIQAVLLITVTLLIGFTACVKKDFDEPPYSGDVDPNIPVNTTIKELKARYDLNAFDRKPTSIGENLTIYGIVTANDKSGNFYKQLMIQDSTGAIAVNINRTGLYGDFPVGRKVYIKCQGLSLGDYGKFIQLGYGLDANGNLGDIPSILMDDFIVQASFPHVVEPKVVTVSDVDTVENSTSDNVDLVGMLIQFERVQFISSELGNTYAESPNSGSGTNRTLKSCDDATILLRTSNYSQFQSAVLPQGSGKLTGIYSRFNDDAQVLVRDTKDAQFTQDRCPFGTASDTLIRIGELRNMFTGLPQLIQNRRIRGVVISDGDDTFGNNITSKNMVLQDGDRGIVLRFASSADNSWEMGDSLEVVISGHTLSEFGRLLQVGDQLKASDVQKLGQGTVVPRVATIQEIITNFEAWESTLVTIQNATLVSSSSGTYRGTVLLNDNSTASDFPMFTQSYAKFSNTPITTGQVKNITGFLYSITSTDRISIRRLTDVTP